MNYLTPTEPAFFHLDELMMDELEMELDTPAAPKTTGRLRPVQQRNRRMARRALVAKLRG